MRQEITDIIIENGIKNLKEYGYPDVSKDNILTDMIYAAFFKRILKENLGQGFDEEINELLSKIG